MSPPADQPPRKGAALAVALVQFLLVTTWTTYAVYLPRLLEAAGLPASHAPWILMADQVAFGVMDFVCGVAADRSLRAAGRVGPWVAGWTLLSCAAFLLMPHVALAGPWAAALLFVLAFTWSATSAALRAPAFALLGRHAARPALPWLNALTLLGLAAGGAVSPWLGLALKPLDPRWPFALASLTLAAAAAALAWTERQQPPRPTDGPDAARRPQLGTAAHLVWVLAMVLLAGGFQVHVSLNSAAQYRLLAPGEALEALLPLFWAGFALGMVPAGALCKRLGALPTMAWAASAAAAAAWACSATGTLAPLVVAQLVAGLAWGLVMVAAFTSATAFGRSGREGLALGTLFAVLALATLGRLGLASTGLARQPDGAAVLALAPVLLWLLAAALCAGLAVRQRGTP